MVKIRHIKIKLPYAVLAVLLALTACLTPLITPTPAQAIGCDDVKIVFARGSGEHLNDVSNQAWRSNIAANLEGSNLKYSFYELGTASQDGFQYPAIAVGGSLEAMFDLIGAKVSAGESYAFGESVNQGVNELEAYMRKTTLACPQTKFVLGGYSQGGMVVTKALQSLNANQIIYAATFGDPKLYLPEGSGWNPEACQGKNLSDYRAYVPDCHTEQGILDGYNPYRKTTLIDKVGAWCNHEDIMCGATVNMFNLLGGHTSYTTQNLYYNAAVFISNKIAAAFPQSGVIIRTRTDVTTQDTAILIDSTGSMSSLISSYKAEAKRLAKQTLEKGGRIALYEYRDLYENPDSTIKHCNFGCSYDEFVQELDKIKTDKGDDLDESALGALLHTMNTLKWQEGATKSIVLLTDAGYHLTDQDGTTLADVTKKSLEIDPINIYTVAPGWLQNTYADLTAATSGHFFDADNELDKVADYLTNRPIAILPLPQYIGAPGDTFTFDASESVAFNTIDHYEWDLDFDGNFERFTNTPIIEATYPNATSGFMQVKVVDKQGFVSTMSAEVIVQNPEALAGITSLDAQELGNSTYEIKFATSNNTGMTLVVVDDNIVGRADGNSFTLHDVDRATTIKLVPYSVNGVKGISNETTVYPHLGVPNTGA